MKKSSFHYDYESNIWFNHKFEDDSGMSLTVADRYIPFDSQGQNMHWHNYFEIEIICDGKGEHHYGDKIDELSYGSAYIIVPTDEHAVVNSPTEKLRLYNICFNEDAIYHDVLLPILTNKGCAVSKFEKEKMEVLLQQVKLLIMYMSEPSPFQANLIKHMLSQICIFVLQGSNAKNETVNNFKTPNAQAVQNTMWYIRSHFRQKITMRELADRINYTPNYLSTIFKDGTGYSCMGYLRHLRVEYACNLLSTTSLSLEDIAYKSGFSTLSHFVMQFHKIKGLTPNEYKKAKFKLTASPQGEDGSLTAEDL